MGSSVENVVKIYFKWVKTKAIRHVVLSAGRDRPLCQSEDVYL